jgi:PKD repeat protein
VTCPSGCDDVKWSINGQSFTGPTVVTTFSDPGQQTATASVTVTGFSSYSDATTTTTARTAVYDIPQPRAGITAPYYAEDGIPITLKAFTYSPVPTSGYWTLPDGSTVQGDALTYTPDQPSSTQLVFQYTTSVTGRPDISTTVSKKVYVKVYNFPQFHIRMITAGEGYTPYTLLCGPSADLSGISGFAYSLKLHWDFGDGTTEDDNRAVYVRHSYLNSGTFTVTMTVTDDRGNTSTDTAQVIVDVPPPPSLDLKLSPSNAYSTPPLTVAVRPVLTGLTGQDRVASYQWQLDGVPQDGMLGFYQANFTEPGEHAVALSVTLLSGLTVTQSKDVQVNADQPPTCSITNIWYSSIRTMAFMPVCTDPDGYLVKYHWDLGNGVVSDLSHPSDKYDSPGTYTVTLTATDNSGSTTTVTKTVDISN